MPARDENAPQIKVDCVGGLDERAAKDQQGVGQFDVLEGMYPEQIGMFTRLPGKTLLTQLPGEVIMGFFQPFDGADTVLVQTDTALYAYTLDEILDRAYVPGITPDPIAEEETMSYCLIAQIEANAANGGSLKGFSAGSPDETTQTFYRRKLTNKVTDPDGFVTFTASSGSSTTGYQTGGTFALATGTYRIYATLTYNNSSNAGGLTAGLYNETDAVFEVHQGGSEPILGVPARGDATDAKNGVIIINAQFEVSGGSKTFSIKHEASTQALARDLEVCGISDECTTNLNVNGAKSRQNFALIQLLQVA